MKTKKKPIIQPYGNVGVDSGQLLIIDPCYLEDFMKLYSYDDMSKLIDFVSKSVLEKTGISLEKEIKILE